MCYGNKKNTTIRKSSKQQYITIIVVLSGHTNHATSCEVLLWQYSFANFGKYDE
jgi:hypothetical protein